MRSSESARHARATTCLRLVSRECKLIKKMQKVISQAVVKRHQASLCGFKSSGDVDSSLSCGVHKDPPCGQEYAGEALGLEVRHCGFNS